MDIRLKRIQLRNFKIHKDFTFEPNSKNASVYADNKKGKTTIYDAFMWLMFGKNSEGRTDFNLKPTGVDRPEVEVQAVLSIDGKEVELKKILTEKWTTKRGCREESFTGHETSYFINGLEVPLGEYKAYLDTIASEDTFKRLTSSAFFLSLKKADMRTLLVNMAGEFDMSVIFEAQPELKELYDYLNEKDFSVEDALKLAKQNLTIYNAENDKISVRIDEVNRAMPEEPEKGWQTVEAMLDKARDNIRKVDEKLGSLHLATMEVKKTQGEIAELEDKIRRYRYDRLDEANKKGVQIRSTLESTNGMLKSQLEKKKSTTYRKDTLINEYTKEAEKANNLKEEYKQVMTELKQLAETKYQEPDGGTMVCELCGQQLPLDQIAEHQEKHRKLFEANKEKKQAELEALKDDILQKAQKIKEYASGLKSDIEKIEAELSEIDNEISIIKQAIAEQEQALKDNAITDQIDLSEDPEYQSMLTRVETLRGLLEEPKDDSAELLEYKEKMQGYVEKFMNILRGKQDIEKGKQRIAELTARGKELSGLIAVERKRQGLCDDFIRARADTLSEKINDMFTMVQFRLFDKQLNGGIADDCTPMVKTESGQYVELAKDGSNSEKIQAGLDIVKAMQRYEGITVPVFIDNAEATTTLPPMDCQFVRLVVSEADKKLRVEIEKGDSKGKEQKKGKNAEPVTNLMDEIEDFNVEL